VAASTLRGGKTTSGSQEMGPIRGAARGPASWRVTIRSRSSGTSWRRASMLVPQMELEGGDQVLGLHPADVQPVEGVETPGVEDRG